MKGGYLKKVTTHELCQNANFENGGTTIQIDILHVVINILSISLLSRVHDTSGYFESYSILTFRRKLIKFCWPVRTFG